MRPLYHLKDADPHVRVIPRLPGRAKAAMVGIGYDEFGAGRADRMHAQLFGDLMTDQGLDPAYGRYPDRAPAPLLVGLLTTHLGEAWEQGRSALRTPLPGV
ncbi:iron-containing redox enzyme family protein [Streptomyces virginiae]|uniref:iron-containing redox enzyme family protein n=1 Tax=Streptomyces virginiae TaxID=1961 RepID=UPI0035D90C1B